MLRVHALYNRNRKVLIFLVFLITAQFATDLYGSIRAAVENIHRVVPPPLNLPWPGCALSYANTKYTLVSWIPLLVVETIFFIMTLLNFIRIALSSRGSGRRELVEVMRISPFLTAFLRDGTAFYLILLFTLVISMVLSAIVQGPIGLSSNAWLIAMYSFATSRLILNLRESAYQSGGGAATWEDTLSIQIRPIEENSEGDVEEQIELRSREAHP
ncbi:hypothetical protein AX15_006583 [Amanita polypyramis BW_CC]|nr:hypothetical protein AX15_006583 [Amanita polypyramis BW_CC]